MTLMKYQRLFQRDDSIDASSIEDDEEKHNEHQTQRVTIGLARCSTARLLCGGLGYMIALLLAIYVVAHKRVPYEAGPHLETPNPRLPALALDLRDRTLPISDWPGHPPSIYRQPPSAAVDAEWERISNVHNIALTSAQVTSLGKDPRKTVRAPPQWGLGDDAHLGLITVFHQTHCLNRLRKAVYYNHYYRHAKGYGRLPPDEERARHFAHLDHCLHFLLETVMCVADTSVTTYNWMENRTLPIADFRINGQCRDFEQVVEWHAGNHVDSGLSWDEEEARWRDFGPRDDDFVLPRIPATSNDFWDRAIGEHVEVTP